jgi:hypothetical protein
MQTKTAAKKTIKLSTFINNYRTELTKRIFKLHSDLVGRVKTVNDDERRIMVLNEPSLKTWAISKGVVFA